MLDILPPAISRTLQDRYLAGVANAEFFFRQSQADEDSVTGALGQALAMREPLIFEDRGDVYQVAISYRKVRGRGPGAPENKFGLDGVFQIRVASHDGHVIREKALPFQAKMNWRGKNSDLVVQARKMEQLRGGIVVDFTDRGYFACPSQAVTAARGSRPQVERSGAIRPLGQVLSNEFLNCTVGTVGTFYDTDQEFGVARELFAGAHMVSTVVQALGRDAA